MAGVRTPAIGILPAHLGRLLLRPLPYVGEGYSEFQHNGLGEGAGCTPSPNRAR